ncbi:hypothetical protein GGR51DRAFT_34063 [Nemania sp. FL0031]|nr:hypothetical protein GGR51DRAFT_34063 [Nemania sp. FL0031]
MFQGDELDSPCKACAKENHAGPAVKCIASSKLKTKGACTNCYYSGTSSTCSLRLAKENEKRKVRAKSEGDQGELNNAMLRRATIRQLEMFLGQVNREIRERFYPETVSRCLCRLPGVYPRGQHHRRVLRRGARVAVLAVRLWAHLPAPVSALHP